MAGIATYNCLGLTGGGTRMLDSVSVSQLLDKDRATVDLAGSIYFFEFNATAIDVENISIHPFKVRPDDYLGGGVWIECIPYSAGTPTGAVLEFAGSVAPGGYLLCNGGSYNIVDEPDLFAIIGYTWGGSGSTFNVPSRKGKTGVGLDTAQTEFNVLGKTGGSKTHTLTVAESPLHTHVQNAHGHNLTNGGSVWRNAGANAFNFEAGYNAQVYTLSVDSAIATNQNTGGGGAHPNLQPFVTFNYIIKT